MSTPTANTSVTTTTTKGLSIGLIIGGIVLAMIIIGVVVYVMKRRRNGGNLGSGAAPSGAPTAANGLGAMNQGTNAVPRTNMNINAGRTTT